MEKKEKYLEIPVTNYIIKVDMIEEKVLTSLEKSLIYIIHDISNLNNILEIIQIDKRIIQQVIIDLLYKGLINISFEQNIIELKEFVKTLVDSNKLDEYYNDIPVEPIYLNILYDISGNLFDRNSKLMKHLLNKPVGDNIEIIRLKYFDDIQTPKIKELSWVHFTPFIWKYDSSLFRINEIKFRENTDNNFYLYFPVFKEEKESIMAINPKIERNWLHIYYIQENLKYPISDYYSEELSFKTLCEKAKKILIEYQNHQNFSNFLEDREILERIQKEVINMSDIKISELRLCNLFKNEYYNIHSYVILVLPIISKIEQVTNFIESLEINDKTFYVQLASEIIDNNTEIINDFQSVQNNKNNKIRFLKIYGNNYTNYVIIDGKIVYYPLDIEKITRFQINEPIPFLITLYGEFPLRVTSLALSQVKNIPKDELKQLNSALSKKDVFFKFNDFSEKIGELLNYISNCYKMENNLANNTQTKKVLSEICLKIMDKIEMFAEFPYIDLILAKDYKNHIFHLLNDFKNSEKLSGYFDLIEPVFLEKSIHLLEKFEDNLQFYLFINDSSSVKNTLNKRSLKFLSEHAQKIIMKEIKIFKLNKIIDGRSSLIMSHFSPFQERRYEYKYFGYFDFGIHLRSKNILDRINEI